MESYKERIHKILQRYNKKLLKRYLEWGPEELREKLEIDADEDWKLIFDYLVLEQGAIKKLVKQNADFIHEQFAEEGPEFIRTLLYIDDIEYDKAWEYVMDYIGISRGAMFEYVTSQASIFRKYIYDGQTSQIREELCLDKDKYNYVWGNILDILLDCVSTDTYSYSTYEQGLRLFSQLYNTGRSHRSLKIYSAIYEEVTEEEE